MNKLKKTIAVVILPVMLFIGACNKDGDSKTETQEEMFNKFVAAMESSLSQNTYTVITGIEDGMDGSEVRDELEYSYTKNSNEYHVRSIGSLETRKSVVKAEDSRYIEYSTFSGNNYSNYVNIDNFNSKYSLSEILDNDLFEIKTLNGMKNIFQQILSEKIDADNEGNMVETSILIEKKDNEYILEIKGSYVYKITGSTRTVNGTLKIYYGEKLNKFTELYKITDAEGTSVYESTTTVNYEYNETLDIDDFSSYPNP